MAKSIKMQSIQPVNSTDDDTINLAGALLGVSAASAVVILIRARHKKLLWCIPLTIFSAAMVVLFNQRQTHIKQVEDRIIAELDTLDPIARAQVMKDVAQQEINKYNITESKHL